MNVGNTQQNLVNLKNLAIAAANLNGGRGDWARWRPGFGALGGSLGTGVSSTAGLLLNVPAVPGYVAPPGGVPSANTGSRVLDEGGNIMLDESGARVLEG